MKQCFKCRETKPLDEFYVHPQMGDGHLNKCKECAKRDVRCNREARIDYYLEYDRVRYHTPVRQAMAKRQGVNYRIRYPHKRQAHSVISNGLRDGKLQRMPCEVCGCPESEAHHPDYSKPRDVRWLCFKHHREVHGQKHFSEK